ncbi:MULTISPECIES: hypothetical protein [Nostocales]|uniref:Uncharacterized protein n=4 Tax=Nostocales TaxID=1161 RepID=A0A8S9T9P7_9CYAN|nr:hypothetical protein DA73_0400027590 [Tolypothrix bouteillei VB521301]
MTESKSLRDRKIGYVRVIFWIERLELREIPASEIDIFYEPAIASLAETQYKSLVVSYEITQQLRELDLVYFCSSSSNLLFQENPLVG